MWELFYLVCVGVFLLLGAWYAPKMTLAILLFAGDMDFLAIIIMIMSLLTEITINFNKKDLDNLK